MRLIADICVMEINLASIYLERIDHRTNMARFYHVSVEIDLFGDILAFSPGGVVPFTSRMQPRIFISHGRRDEVLKFENTAMGIAPGLTAMGLDVTFQPFEGNHELRSQEMQAGLDWWLKD